MRLRTRLSRLEARRNPGPHTIEVWLTDDGEHFTHEGETLNAAELRERQRGALVIDLVELPPREL